MVTLKNWQKRMSEDMVLRDFRPRTQEAYSRVVRQFLEHLDKEPDELTDEDIRRYFLYLKEERKLSPSSRNIAVHGLRFFFTHTMGQDLPVFDLTRVRDPRKLPVVLSTGEVRQVLSAVEHPVRRMALTVIYGLEEIQSVLAGLSRCRRGGVAPCPWVRLTSEACLAAYRRASCRRR